MARAKIQCSDESSAEPEGPGINTQPIFTPTGYAMGAEPEGPGINTQPIFTPTGYTKGSALDEDAVVDGNLTGRAQVDDGGRDQSAQMNVDSDDGNLAVVGRAHLTSLHDDGEKTEFRQRCRRREKEGTAAT